MHFVIIFKIIQHKNDIRIEFQWVPTALPLKTYRIIKKNILKKKSLTCFFWISSVKKYQLPWTSILSTEPPPFNQSTKEKPAENEATSPRKLSPVLSNLSVKSLIPLNHSEERPYSRLSYIMVSQTYSRYQRLEYLLHHRQTTWLPPHHRFCFKD